MHVATIDSGTTNSRVYIATGEAEIVAKASRAVGVRDTSRTGRKDALRSALVEAFEEALAAADLGDGDVDAVVASGMITSEMGLIELEHLWAPAGRAELAAGMEHIEDGTVLPIGRPVYFVRGIKNRYDPATAGVLEARGLDFMRGEEAQIVGLLERDDITPPVTVVVLSSHTKFVPVDADGRILGGVTTISGQVFDAVKSGTVLGKSIAGSSETPPPQRHPELVHAAYEWSRTAGMLRGLFITRFLDTLLETSVEERQLYLQTVVAAEDLEVVSELEYLGFPAPRRLVLIGRPGRVHLYRHLFETELRITNRITTITDDREVDRLSILGAIALLRQAGVVS